MPDIDSLSIRLSSSSADAVNAIDKVIKSLEQLNAALNNYTDDSKFVKGMGSLTGGLSGIARSINSIDIDKLKSLTTTLDKLGLAGDKLVKLNFVQSFSELGAQSQKVNQFLSNTAKSMAEEFKLPKGQVDNLAASLRKLYDANGDSTKIRAAKDEVRDLVTQFGKSKQAADAWAKETKRILKQNTIYLPEQLKADWGEQFNTKKGILGIGNTTTDINKGTSLEKVAAEMNEIAGTAFTLDRGITACADSMIKFMQSPDATSLAMYKEEMDQLDAELMHLTGDFNKATMSKQASDNEFAREPDISVSFMEETAKDAQTATVEMNNAAVATEQLKTQLSTELQNPFEGLIKGIESLNEVNIPADKFVGITQLANSIGKFGGKNSDKAITNIPKFTKAFADMAAQLGRAPQISDNLVRLAEAMSKFSTKTDTATKTTNKFGAASKILSQAFRGMYPHTMRAHHGFTSLAAIFGRLYANFFLLIRGARALGRAMDYSSSMTEAQNVVAVTFGKNSDVMDKFAQTAIKDFGMAKLSATEFASRFQAMGSTMGITAEKVGKANAFIEERTAKNSRAYKELGTSVADMSINLTKLTADMASLYNQDYADVAQDMQAIYTGMTRPLRKYGLDLTQATLKEWALANGLDANIEKMSQAEKTMLRYQYVMTRASGAMGDFQKTADTWANAMRTVKQLLQEVARTIGEALINALRPALLAFRNFLFNFLELTQSALNALGKLLGWKQINFASASLVDDTEDYADALDDAAGAAKKLKGQLRGIDELNNLTTNDKGGGSGSGLSGLGAELTDWLDNLDESDKPYESAIKNWYEFGQKIANAIKNGLADIDWEGIKEKGRTFASNLASWLNGLIQPDMFFQIGSTIGNAVMTAIGTIGEFAKDADWEKWGASIAAGINGFFDKFEGDKAAESINSLTEGLKTLFENAIKDIHWDEVFKDLWDFLKDLDKDPLALAAAVAGISGLIISAAMANPIVIPAITVTISAFYLAGKTIGEYIAENEDDPLAIKLSIAFGGVAQIDKDENPFRQNWIWEDWNKEEVWGPYKDFYGEIGKWASSVKERLKEGMTLDDIFIEDIFKPFWPAIETKATEIGEWIDEKATALFDKIDDFVTDNVVDPIESGFDSITTYISEWWTDSLAPWFTKEKWHELLQPIRDQLKYAFQAGANSAVGALNKVLGGIEKMVNGASDIINLLIEVASKISGKDISKLSKISIPRIAIPYANGGYPQVGSLFLAGEAGSEMVGTINGKTGVVSNGEITGIADAIRSTSDTEIQLLRQQNTLLQGILNKEFGISSDSIFNSVRSSARDFTNRTGDPAFI